MFDNISSKIKGLAKFIAVICLVGGILVAFVGLVNYASEKDCLEYATIYGGAGHFTSLEEAGNKAYHGLQMLKYGLITCSAGTISTWPLYGFGELLEKVSCIADHMKKQDNDETM